MFKDHICGAAYNIEHQRLLLHDMRQNEYLLKMNVFCCLKAETAEICLPGFRPVQLNPVDRYFDIWHGS